MLNIVQAALGLPKVYIFCCDSSQGDAGVFVQAAAGQSA